MLVIDNRDPIFLKTVWPMNLDLIPTEDRVPSGHKYITFDAGRWRCWRMTAQRVPIPLGRFGDIAGAIYMARK
jgi:hypothetical protein